MKIGVDSDLIFGYEYDKILLYQAINEKDRSSINQK